MPVHVDAASGGFVAPFLQPDLVWDFRLPRVVSIQTSGHKFGLVYPGVGWVLWRDAEHLPEDLVFHVNYLGGDMPTFALNFSRPGAQVVLQYFQFLRLGSTATGSSSRPARTSRCTSPRRWRRCRSSTWSSEGRELPVVTFSRQHGRHEVRRLRRVAQAARAGLARPAYTMPPKRDDLAVLRVVVRNGFSHDMAELFLRDLRAAVDCLDDLAAPMPREEQPSELPPLSRGARAA